jgi:hypothetical protein
MLEYVECVDQISRASCSHAVEEPVLKVLIEASGTECWEFDTTRGAITSVLSNT